MCGFLASDAAGFNPLLDNLPPVIVADGERDSGWLAGLRGDGTIAAIAEKVGYGSAAAFSRAFRKATATPPSAWRKRKAASPGP